MESQDLKRFIAQTGFRTLAEIKEHFKGDDQEVVSTHLEYLISGHGVKKISYSKGSENVEQLYYIPA